MKNFKKATLSVALLVLSVFWFSGVASAERLKEPVVEYSADQKIESDQMVMKGKIYYAPGKQRMDQEMKGQKQSLILRKDKELEWRLLPERAMYIERSTSRKTAGAGKQAGHGAASDSSDEFDYNFTVIGPDVVNGIKSTKRKFSTRALDGNVINGFMWTSKDNIVVKMDATTKGAPGTQGRRIVMEITNLKIEKQDPAVFEVPPGYTKFNMMGGINTAPSR